VKAVVIMSQSSRMLADVGQRRRENAIAQLL